MQYGGVVVLSITALTFLISEILKLCKIKKNLLPLICGLVGLVFGVIGYYAKIPGIPTDLFASLGVGISSGLAATGIHQIGKQFSHYHDDDYDDYDDYDEQDSDCSQDCKDDESED